MDGYERIYEKLDKMLCNNDWRLLFENAKVRVLHRTYSDHHPSLIQLDPTTYNLRSKLFMFEMAWLQHKEYAAFVKENWKANLDLD